MRITLATNSNQEKPLFLFCFGTCAGVRVLLSELSTSRGDARSQVDRHLLRGGEPGLLDVLGIFTLVSGVDVDGKRLTKNPFWLCPKKSSSHNI